jgi:hypothetical protein
MSEYVPANFGGSESTQPQNTLLKRPDAANTHPTVGFWHCLTSPYGSDFVAGMMDSQSQLNYRQSGKRVDFGILHRGV